MFKYIQTFFLLAILIMAGFFYFQEKKSNDLIKEINFTVNENKIKLNEMENTLKSVESKSAMLQAQIMRLNVNRDVD